MHFSATASFIARARVVALAVALGVLLPGCALDTGRGAGRPASPCGMGAVLYCDVDDHLEIESCHCARYGDLRQALGNLSRP